MTAMRGSGVLGGGGCGGVGGGRCGDERGGGGVDGEELRGSGEGGGGGEGGDGGDGGGGGRGTYTQSASSTLGHTQRLPFPGTAKSRLS